ncbi:MAG: polyamine ABC transporter substrate-binding protein [Gammaproteobacteria bacterium]
MSQSLPVRPWLAAAVTLVLAACGGGKQESSGEAAPAAAPEEKVLNVYNWSDYIAEDTIANFQTATGIKVNYDVFDNNEVLEAKLLAGSTGYDVVVPSASFLERQIKAGVFRKLDKSKLPNWQNLDPAVMKVLALHDPGNEHAVPWLWGTTGIGYNVAKVKAALGEVPVNSWSLIFDPKIAAKLKGCGITLLDAPSEVIDSVQIYLGLDPNGEKPEDLKAAADVLMSVRPYVKYLHSSQYINDLANGEVCVSLGWSGDVLQARDRAVEANKGIEIAYTVPKEGAIMWFDMMAIPADAKHPDNAHAWINNAMDPKVIAGVSNFVQYANGNAAALPMVDDAVKNNPGIYPDEATKAKLHAHLAESEAYSREANRAWTKFRTGK